MPDSLSSNNPQSVEPLKTRHELAHYTAELIGTFFLVFFGCGSVIVAEINGLTATTIPFVFGGTVMIMIYAVGHISGAHFNPAVTIAFWVIKKFPGSRVFGYLMAQFLGALLASTIHFFILNSGHSFGATTPHLNMILVPRVYFI